MDQSLRAALANLETAGQLARIEAAVTWEYEASGILWHLGKGPAVLMQNVVGYPGWAIAGNIITGREKFAQAMGWPVAEVQRRVVAALDQPLKPEIVEDGPVREVVQREHIDLLRDMPIPIVSEHDAGRYISAGVVITSDPETGRRNACIQRLQVQGPDRLGIYMAPTDNWGFLQRYRELKRPMPVAIAIGNHPAVLLASQLLVPTDEFQTAGALLGEPLRMLKGLTVDLEVPADAEIVLEGFIDPEETHPEGPFGEFPGTYAPQRPGPVIRLTAVYMRWRPIFQLICASYHPEHLWTGGIAREALLYRAVRVAVPTLRSVCMPEGGLCRFHAVLSMTKRTEGEGKKAILAALASQDLLKWVVAVDDDIDPTDATQVQWALATRMRGDEDLFVIPGVKSNPVDPTAVNRTVAKVGIDATQRMDAPAEQRLKAAPPTNTLARLRERWQELGLPGEPK